LDEPQLTLNNVSGFLTATGKERISLRCKNFGEMNLEHNHEQVCDDV
jgi:hypothetical protein